MRRGMRLCSTGKASWSGGGGGRRHGQPRGRRRGRRRWRWAGPRLCSTSRACGGGGGGGLRCTRRCTLGKGRRTARRRNGGARRRRGRGLLCGWQWRRGGGGESSFGGWLSGTHGGCGCRAAWYDGADRGARARQQGERRCAVAGRRCVMRGGSGGQDVRRLRRGLCGCSQLHIGALSVGRRRGGISERRRRRGALRRRERCSSAEPLRSARRRGGRRLGAWWTWVWRRGGFRLEGRWRGG